MDPFAWNSAAYDKSRCPQDDIRVKRVLPLIGTAGKILDLGCLDGTIGAEFIKKGNRVFGIDASKTAVAKAQARGIEAKLGNLEEPFPFEDGKFDLVFAGEIIEHIFDIDLLLEETFRVLKPSGALVATTPNLAAFGRRLLLLVNRNPNIEISFTGEAAGHIRYFLKQTLLAILHKHGFQVTDLTSDVVNFNSRGTIRSYWLAKTFPTFGRCLIVKALKCGKEAVLGQG